MDACSNMLAAGHVNEADGAAKPYTLSGTSMASISSSTRIFILIKQWFLIDPRATPGQAHGMAMC
jgi:hypothetical protein